MSRVASLKPRIKRAALLGLLGLASNSSIYWLSDHSFPLHLGNTFIFAAILSLGFSGGLIATIVGALPFALILGTPIEAMRMAIMAVVMGSVTRKTHRVHLTSLVMLSWILALGPLNKMLLGLEYLQLPLANHWLFWSDTLSALIAGSVLLNTSLWCKLRETPRHVSLAALSGHALSAIAIGAVFTVYATNGGFGVSTWHLVLLISAIQLTATTSGYLWARFLLDNFHSLSRDTLTKREDTNTFSGLSTEHWRRQQQANRTDSSKGTWKRPTQISPISPEELPPSQASREGVCVVNSVGTITFTNGPFVDLLGIKTENHIGRRLDTVEMSEGWSKALLDLISETQSKGPRIRELKVKSTDGTFRYYEMSARPTSASADMIAEPGVDATILTIRDITTRRSIESGVMRSQRLEAMGALMSGIAHEFNNCLTAIAAKASLAEKESDSNPNKKTALKEIREYTHEAGDMVKRLLSLVESSSKDYECTDLSSFIQDKLTILRKLVGENYEINFSKPSEAIGAVCNKALLDQALTNLMIYARDSYSSKTGSINLSLDTEVVAEEAAALPLGVHPGLFCRLKLTHSGTSMNRNVIARIFDPSNTDRGSGLGLSIVFAIVRSHDGFLTAESHSGKKGTTISLYLPWSKVVVAETRTSSILAKPAATDALKGKNILVVEDEPTVRQLTSYMLTELGCAVTSCDNGRDAIDIANKNSFDLILVDYVIPKIGGHELLEQLQGVNSQAKMLVMTGYGATIEDKLATGIIQKPFDMDGLEQAIKEALV